jgi:cytidine deaminase
VTTDRRCGTNKGYFAHRRRDEDPCAACRQAHYEYQADGNAARSRALTRLAKEYPDRFREIFAEELSAA